MHDPPVAHVGATVVVEVGATVDVEVGATVDVEVGATVDVEVGATVDVEVGATVVVVGATVATERIQVCRLPDLHTLVIGQRKMPDFPPAHNNNTFPTGTERNGAAQPDDGATDTTRDRSSGFNDEASQHNNGADFDADQV
jgi:hypothetical protein